MQTFSSSWPRASILLPVPLPCVNVTWARPPGPQTIRVLIMLAMLLGLLVLDTVYSVIA
jgi:hypothetical protein